MINLYISMWINICSNSNSNSCTNICSMYVRMYFSDVSYWGVGGWLTYVYLTYNIYLPMYI